MYIPKIKNGRHFLHNITFLIRRTGWLHNMHSCLNEARAQKHNWVGRALPLLGKEELTSGHTSDSILGLTFYPTRYINNSNNNNNNTIAWAADHAYMQHLVEDHLAKCALLPLFTRSLPLQQW